MICITPTCLDTGVPFSGSLRALSLTPFEVLIAWRLIPQVECNFFILLRFFVGKCAEYPYPAVFVNVTSEATSFSSVILFIHVISACRHKCCHCSNLLFHALFLLLRSANLTTLDFHSCRNSRINR